MEIDDSTLLEKIGQTAHIINQSMSLIALENDRQRQDLEQYSNQSNKYDTTYQNFDNTQSSPGWNGREMIPVPASNRVMYDASPSETISRRSSSDTLFGATKSASMDIRGGASSFDLNSSSTNLISGASSSE